MMKCSFFFLHSLYEHVSTMYLKLHKPSTFQLHVSVNSLLCVFVIDTITDSVVVSPGL